MMSLGEEQCSVSLRDLYGACLSNTAQAMQEEFRSLFLEVCAIGPATGHRGPKYRRLESC